MNKGRILIIVQNLPVPFDRRVWQEANTLRDNGYEVCIICPQGTGYTQRYECINGIHIYRHPLPIEAHGAKGYLLEYSWSLLWEFYLTCKVFFIHGFDGIHACNPPDTIFLIGGFFKFLLGKKFLFDHHDINPELYEAKFGRRDFFYRLLCWCERLTFAVADISIATNNSYRQIALERGKMQPDKIFVVRSGPDLRRLKIIPPHNIFKQGKPYLVGYVGVMGQQEGIEYLLEAVRHLTQDMKRNDIHFILIGGGPELARMKQMAADLCITQYVTFTGRVADEILLAALNSCDVCVNPDVVNAMNDKSTMNKIMEYMALCKPIVQFDVTEGRVSAAESSLYAKANDAYDFAEKILWLLEHPQQRAEMGELGRKRIEETLAWKYEAPKLLAAYDAIFSDTSGKKSLAYLWRKSHWYYHRLKAMSAAEIQFRIEEKIRRVMDKNSPPVAATLVTSLLPAIPGLRDLVKECEIPQELITAWQSIYSDASQGRFFLLAQQWPDSASSSKWHCDPVTGLYWPHDSYCFDINYRDASHLGDVKYVWELNRLQYLQPIAMLALIHQDAEMARFVLEEIENWIDHNPPYLGVNWVSGIELAMRVVSILFVISLIGEHASMRQQAKLWNSLETHGLWLARYPSRFSSANNHSAAEGLGLFLIGILCPALADSMRWRETGWKLLCEAATHPLLPDGTGAEQAISYTAFTLEMLMLGLFVARSCNIIVPNYYKQRLESSAEYLRWFTDCKGNHPHIGDDDNARVLGVYLREENYVNSVLGCLAAILQRADLCPAGYNAQMRNIVLGFPPHAVAAVQGIRNFNDGGYTICRHFLRGKEVLLAIDHGPLGYLSIAAHGHADTLSLWLHIDGQPVLVDAGTYLYHSGGKWRNYFRSTAAHNTLSIEGADSSIMAGNFNWSHKAKASLTFSEYSNAHWRVEAEHDGYVKRFGATHRRNVTCHYQQGITVEDTLIATSSHTVTIGFLLHPILDVVIEDDTIIIRKGGEVILSVSHTGALTTALEQAWYSPRFGEKIATKRIVFSGTLKPGEKAVTFFQYV